LHCFWHPQDRVFTPVLAVRSELEVKAEQRMGTVGLPGHVGTDHQDRVSLTMWSNAYAERFVLTARTEVTDRMLMKT
jgi:hypothetical protein